MTQNSGAQAGSSPGGRGGAHTCACEREVCVWAAFVCCCFACDCVLELVVCQVRFARVFCPWLSLYESQASSMAKLLQKLPSARKLVLQQKGSSKTRS